MRVEAEPRRSIGLEPTRPATNNVACAVAGSARMADGLDWQSFSAAYFPGRRRHDLEALTAYAAYRRRHDLEAQSAEGLAVVEAKRGPAGSTAVQDWEDEGGAAF